MSEPMMSEGIGWAASEWHTFRIEWGGGQSRFYILGRHGDHVPQALFTALRGNEGRTVRPLVSDKPHW